MPKDVLVNEVSDYDITKYDANVDDFPNATSAEARLQKEANAIAQKPLARPTPVVRDVTEDFVAATEKLPPGELVKDEYFTLFEAVSALEIMDSKMDSGYIPPGDSFEPDFDVCRGLDATEVLWIIDELFRLEISFQDGCPLSQSIFTSLHVFRLLSPDNSYPYNIRFEHERRPGLKMTADDGLVHVVLRAYCIAVIKCVECTLRTIQAQTYYEEEDFVTGLFGRELLPKLSSQEAGKLLVDAIDWLDGSDIEWSLKYALKHRLESREHLLLSMEDSADLWLQLKSKIDNMDQHHEMSKVVPDAFSDKVTRQLATSTPPRPMPQLSWQGACKLWIQLCDDIDAANRLTSLSIRQNPNLLRRAVWAFAYRDPQPNTYARAKMQELLTKDDCVSGDTAQFGLMLTDIRDLVLAGDPLADPVSFQIELTSDPRHRVSQLIDDFMLTAFTEYLDLYRIVCQNRCRMRRTSTQAVIVLDELETTAQETDRKINEIISPRCVRDQNGTLLVMKPLSQWIRNYKLQVVAWIVQLGFETDLYLPHEFSSMYWIFNDFVCARKKLLQQIERHILQRLDLVEREGNREYIAQCHASKDWLRSLLSKSAVEEQLSLALAQLYALLERLKVVDPSPRRPEDSQLLYEARLKPLLALRNDRPLDHETVESLKHAPTSTIDQICSRVADRVKSAKANLASLKNMTAIQGKYIGTEHEWKQEMKSLEIVCVAISVATSQLRQICEKNVALDDTKQDGDLRGAVELVIPPPGKRYHDWWVVPQLKEKK